jgi:hypothetical protein
MMFGYLTLFTALILSVSAAVYSILGLTAIFAAAFWPIVVLGGSLEFGKIVTTLWLHKYWDRAGLQYKVYLSTAVAILMLLTSMGVFGFLSKAHTDQSLVSGDVQSKIAIYDEKIKISRENIDANRKALKQMDEAVDQVMARSSDEKGADKAVAIRRGQQKERGRLLAEIDAEQKKITGLNEERAPIAAEVRKVEAEVGPIKYIAAMVYGDNPDANLLEKAVRWVIILIVIVFDPLALTLLLAATKTFEWERGVNIMAPKRKEPEPDPTDNLSTDDPPDQIKIKSSGFVASNFWPFPKKEEILEPVKDVVEDVGIDDDDNEAPEIKEAMRRWKEANPNDTLKHQRVLLDQGKIKELPWMQLVADNQTPTEIKSGFGTRFPDDPSKGDVFVRVDQLPSTLYKFNGNIWIQVDKTLTDHYTYDTAYINHLIDKISSGELDIDLLSEGEREQITHQLQSRTNQ